MKQREFDEVIRKIALLMHERRYGPDTIGQLVQFGRTIAERFPGKEADIDVPTAIDAYVDSWPKAHHSYHRHRDLKRFARIVKSHIFTGTADFSYAQRVHRDPLSSLMEDILQGYRQYLNDTEKSNSTIVKWDAYAYRFLRYLESRGCCSSLHDLEAIEIDAFIAWVSKLHTASGLAGELSMLRSLLAFTDDSGLTSNARCQVPQGRYVRSVPIAVFTDEQLRQVIATIDNTDAQGKRDLVVVLLAMEMGLRSSDIVNLKLGDIDWEKESLFVSQAKTGRPLHLPIPRLTMASLADYVLHARPKCGYKEVVLVMRRPFRPFSRGPALYSIAKRYYVKAGVLDEGCSRAGLHRLRHTYATRLLNGGLTPDRIATALGHAKVETAMSYVEIDVSRLSLCCLDLPTAKGADDEDV
jgi:integrase